MKKQESRKGFTLIEVLLVIGVIAVLSGIVIIAINPTIQLAKARNIMRRRGAQQILNAVQQYVVDNDGSLPEGIDTTLRMVGTDTSGCGVLCAGVLGSPVNVSIRVAGSSDDAEERTPTQGYVYVSSTDLELIHDYSSPNRDQIVGMRFRNVLVPQGSIVSNTSITFTTDEATSESTSLTFYNETIDDAPTFTTGEFNISNRSKTAASVSWSDIPVWNTVGEEHRTPDLSSILQEIVNRDGWASGNDVVFIVEGSGRRTAESYDGSAGLAPLLSFDYRIPDGETTASTCLNLGASLTGSFLASIPEDPQNGNDGKTYYAVKQLSNNRLRVQACNAELGENIVIEQ